MEIGYSKRSLSVSSRRWWPITTNLVCYSVLSKRTIATLNTARQNNDSPDPQEPQNTVSVFESRDVLRWNETQIVPKHRQDDFEGVDAMTVKDGYEDTNEYAVEHILGKRTKRYGKKLFDQYLVKWEGYDVTQ